MKVTSLRYLDAKFHHPSLGASPPNRGKSSCLPPELSLLLKRRSVNKFRHRYSMLWPLSVVLVANELQRTVGYPSTSWASCIFCLYYQWTFLLLLLLLLPRWLTVAGHNIIRSVNAEMFSVAACCRDCCVSVNGHYRGCLLSELL